jgi:hypothetical protein
MAPTHGKIVVSRLVISPEVDSNEAATPSVWLLVIVTWPILNPSTEEPRASGLTVTSGNSSE